MVGAKAHEGVVDDCKQKVGLKEPRLSAEAQFGSGDVSGRSPRVAFHVKQVWTRWHL